MMRSSFHRRFLVCYLAAVGIWAISSSFLSQIEAIQKSYRSKTEAGHFSSLVDTSIENRHADKQQDGTKGHISADASSMPSACIGKEKLVDILDAAGHIAPHTLCGQLSTWKETTDLYGKNPVVVGLETCERYRAMLSAEANNGQAIKPKVRVTGLYNSGTTAFSLSLEENLEHLPLAPGGGTKYHTVPWGKHVPAKYRWVNSYIKEDANITPYVLPVILVRDPYRWMASMVSSSVLQFVPFCLSSCPQASLHCLQCIKPYDANWTRPLPHCPNLVPIDDDRGHEIPSYQVTVTTKQTYYNPNLTDVYDSLGDMWSVWNLGYLNADFPRIFVRFEDVLLHGEKIMAQVSECAGLPMTKPFVYQLNRAKHHGENFVTAIIKYMREDGRYDGMTRADLDYASNALSSDLMSSFHYRYAPASYHPPPLDYSKVEDAPTGLSTPLHINVHGQG
jgi:hypothetical protein